jgi:hypothetical protein
VSCVCGQYFCWLCGGATRSGHTVTRHTCGRYKEDEEEDIEKAQRDLKRYTHYYSRWKAHSDSLKLEKKQKELLEKKILALESKESGVSDYGWLKKALQRLFTTRRALSYSYPLAFHMFGDDIQFRDDKQQKIDSNRKRKIRESDRPSAKELDDIQQKIDSNRKPKIMESDRPSVKELEDIMDIQFVKELDDIMDIQFVKELDDIMDIQFRDDKQQKIDSNRNRKIMEIHRPSAKEWDDILQKIDRPSVKELDDIQQKIDSNRKPKIMESHRPSAKEWDDIELDDILQKIDNYRNRKIMEIHRPSAKELKQTLFEDHQQRLEGTVERLSKIIEGPFDGQTVRTNRLQVIDLTFHADTCCKKMYEYIQDDLLGNLELTKHFIAPYSSEGVHILSDT